MEEWDGLGPEAKLLGVEVRRPRWEGENAPIGVVCRDFDDVAQTADFAHSHGLAMQGVNRVGDGDTFQRFIELMCSLLIASQ